MLIFRACLGLAFFCFVAWCLSSHKKKFPWRITFVGILMQFALAGLILNTEYGREKFEDLSQAALNLISMAKPGSELVFGSLAKYDGPGGFIFAFAGTGLPVIIFFSSLMAVLYHLRIMQVLIYCVARVMVICLGVSGAESMAIAANIFVGQTEAPLVVRPYIARMTMSELNALMTGGFATLAGSVLGVYLGILGEEFGPHLLTASVMSAPAAFVMAKIMQPETEESVTGAQVELTFESTASNVIEAAANGAMEGLKLFLNVIAMLIAFLGLVALINALLMWGSEQLTLYTFLDFGGPLTLNRIFGWVFAPVAWMMGVEGWHDCQLMGSLLGTKISINEFVALSELKEMIPHTAETALAATAKTTDPSLLLEHDRTAKIAAYALCGFANFASIGVQIGGISPLAPERKTDLSKLALRAMLGGAFASWMTATIAGIFV